MAILHKLFGGPTPRLTVIFLHGLTGDPRETWVASCNEKLCWPMWLEAEIPNICAYIVDIPRPSSLSGQKKEIDIHERAVEVLERLAAEGVGIAPIVFVCHSLRGILAKEILRSANESTDEGWVSIANQTKLVCFLATPHQGAALTAALKVIPLRFTSTHVDVLANDGGYLQSLNHSYRNMAEVRSIRTISYYETFKTKNAAIIVSRESADPVVGSNRPIAVDANHMTICKPVSRQDLVVQSTLISELDDIAEALIRPRVHIMNK